MSNEAVQVYWCFTCNRYVPASDYVNDPDFDIVLVQHDTQQCKKVFRQGVKMCRDCNQPFDVNTKVLTKIEQTYSNQ